MMLRLVHYLVEEWHFLKAIRRKRLYRVVTSTNVKSGWFQVKKLAELQATHDIVARREKKQDGSTKSDCLRHVTHALEKKNSALIRHILAEGFKVRPPKLASPHPEACNPWFLKSCISTLRHIFISFRKPCYMLLIGNVFILYFKRKNYSFLSAQLIMKRKMFPLHSSFSFSHQKLWTATQINLNEWENCELLSSGRSVFMDP